LGQQRSKLGGKWNSARFLHQSKPLSLLESRKRLVFILILYSIDSLSSPPEARAKFQSNDQTTAYENLIKEQVFDRVMEEHAELAKTYESFLEGVQQMGNIKKFEEKSLTFMSRQISPSYDVFLQQLSKLNDKGYTFLKEFAGKRQGYFACNYK
jgi:hypothetical protein